MERNCLEGETAFPIVAILLLVVKWLSTLVASFFRFVSFSAGEFVVLFQRNGLMLSETDP